jgi:hypothetical protein
MEMKKLRAGRLRGIGYDEKARILRIELDNGELLEYDRITLEMWRRFSESTAPWSYYCDNIQDELTPRRFASQAMTAKKKNPLDDLFS